MSEDVLQLIEDCENRSHKLNDWELGFIDSISKVLERGGSLTERQLETLEQIWEKIT